MHSVLIIGAGLVGTSVGKALTRAGVRVFLEDLATSHALVASSLGAGEVKALEPNEVDLVVVATPPASIAAVVNESLIRFPNAVITDVGSVKAPIMMAVADMSDHAERYVPSHPMAGSQFTGPLTASADLFRDRTWVITPAPGNSPESVELVRWLARTTGAFIVEIGAEVHDEAVAQMSHVPHLMSILTASHLRAVPGENLQLAGQGIRDVTRIAGSDPAMWRQIITTNAQAVRHELQEVAADLDYLISVLERPDDLEAFLRLGQHGAKSLVVKHGMKPQPVMVVTVEIPDEPRALGRLFGDVGDLGFNVEDFELSHDAIRQVGYLSIAVRVDQAQDLRDGLVEQGWRSWSEGREEQT